LTALGLGIAAVGVIAVLGTSLSTRSPAAVGARAMPVESRTILALPSSPERESGSTLDLRRRAREVASLGLLEEAERLLERAIAIAAHDALIWNDLGVIRVRRGEIRRGIEAFERGLALDAGSAEIHRNLGVALDRVGRPGKAATHYRAFLVLAPEHPDRALVERRLASE
jgi:Flp pilus assembly protein TadD